MNNTPALYYESHVTIEPVFNERLAALKTICNGCGFRVAELLMQKNANAGLTPHDLDTFCTGRSNDVSDLVGRMNELLAKLAHANFTVYRYKVESALIDVRLKSKQTNDFEIVGTNATDMTVKPC